jgi:hypothetical protein
MPPWGFFRGERRPPNKAQARALTSSAAFVGFCGGVGSGKTHWLVRHGIYRALQNGPRKNYLVIAPSFRVLRTSTWDHFVRFLAEFERTNGRKLHTKMLTSPQRMEIELVGGITFTFLTGKDPNAIIGQTIAGFLIDEAAFLPQGMAVWNACLERLRDASANKLFGLWASSPHGPVGVVQFFVERCASNDPDYAMVFSRTDDNAANLPPGYISRQLAGKSERQIRQQLNAEILDYEGSVYAGEFSSTLSLAKGWKTRRDIKGREIYLTIDWGPTNPHALWIAHDPDEDFDVVFGEFCPDSVPHREFIERALEHGRKVYGLAPPDKGGRGDYDGVYGDDNPPRARRYALRYFGQRDCSFHSYRVPDGGVLDGINVVSSRLLDADGNRRLLFAPELERTNSRRRILQCMRLYQWQQRNAGGAAFLDDTLQPLKNNFDHGPDALRYYCAPRYRWRYYEAASLEAETHKRPTF